MSVLPQIQMSLEEYADYDDGTEKRYELVDGQLVEMPVESWDASTISLYLFSQLLAFVPYYLLRHKDTEVAVVSRSAKARIPDLMVVPESVNIQMSGKKGLIPLTSDAPLLVIEVVSPGNPGDANYDRDYVEKRAEYAARGIEEYWLVDAKQGSVSVLNLKAGTYQTQVYREEAAIQSVIFPAFTLTAAQILSGG